MRRDATRPMCKARLDCSAAVLTFSLLVAACAAPAPVSVRDVADANDTGGRLKTTNPADKALLQELPRMPSGAARRLGDATVVAEAAYSAASGQTCRAVHVTVPPRPETIDRLACSDGRQWFFVPDVFGGGAPKE